MILRDPHNHILKILYQMKSGVKNYLKGPYDHILKLSDQYGYFQLSYEGVLSLGDHGHDRFWQGKVRLDQVRLGFINDLMGPLLSNPVELAGRREQHNTSQAESAAWSG